MTDYLEQVKTGKAVILSTSGEDDFSKLEDEIYKTVTYLYQTKEAAVRARNDFAENLSNIAHQIKTPITAISLSVQMMKQDFGGKYPEQVEKQLARLMSYLGAGEFFAEAPLVPIFIFMLVIWACVALAYRLGWRSLGKICLAEVLRDDTMM